MLFRKLGTDLTAIEGIGINTSLVVLTEIGMDVTGFPSKSTLPLGWGFVPTTGLAAARR